MDIKYDCFALDFKDMECEALGVLDCKNCKFYKNKDLKAIEDEKCKQRAIEKGFLSRKGSYLGGRGNV